MRRTATKVATLTPNTIQKTDEMDWAKASWRIAAPPRWRTREERGKVGGEQANLDGSEERDPDRSPQVEGERGKARGDSNFPPFDRVLERHDRRGDHHPVPETDWEADGHELQNRRRRSDRGDEQDSDGTDRGPDDRGRLESQSGNEGAAQEESAGQRKRECVNHVPLVAEARTQPLRREQRQERNDAEECGGAKNVDDGRRGDVPNPEQSRREHGLPRPSFREDETGQEQDAPREQGDLRPRGPPEGGPAEEQPHHQQAEEPDEQRRAEPIAERTLVGRLRFTEREIDEGEGDDAHGQVDVEDPPPADRLRQEGAEGGGDREGDSINREEEALDLPAAFGREHVSRNGDRRRHKGAESDPLERPERNELVDVPRGAGQRGTGHEDQEAEEEEPLPAVQVGQFPKDRDRHGLHDEKGAEDPCKEV